MSRAKIHRGCTDYFMRGWTTDNQWSEHRHLRVCQADIPVRFSLEMTAESTPLRALSKSLCSWKLRTVYAHGQRSPDHFHFAREGLRIEGRVHFCIIVKINEDVARRGFRFGGDEFCAGRLLPLAPKFQSR